MQRQQLRKEKRESMSVCAGKRTEWSGAPRKTHVPKERREKEKKNFHNRGGKASRSLENPPSKRGGGERKKDTPPNRAPKRRQTRTTVTVLGKEKGKFQFPFKERERLSARPCGKKTSSSEKVIICTKEKKNLLPLNKGGRGLFQTTKGRERERSS